MSNFGTQFFLATEVPSAVVLQLSAHDFQATNVGYLPLRRQIVESITPVFEVRVNLLAGTGIHAQNTHAISEYLRVHPTQVGQVKRKSRAVIKPE